MRLKGGKVLIDLSNVDISTKPKLSFSLEEVNAILEKGLSLKVKIEDYIFTRDVIFNDYEVGFLNCKDFLNDTENEIIYYISLEIGSGELSVLEQ